MSYNTRRQGGVGRGTSQVMYHQQQSPSPRSAGPVRSAASPQNSQGYSAGYNSQSEGNQGYSTQQYQAQSQLVPPPPPPPMSIQQSPAPKPLHGILKTESSPSQQQHIPEATSSPGGAGDTSNDVDITSESGEGDARQKPSWMKKRPPGFKLNKTVKRRRQNARLRKLLQPKNAIMVLNELVPGVKFTIQDHVNALSQQTFQVSLEIEGKVFSGQALSKTNAKQICAENALKSLIINKITKSPLIPESKGDDENADGEEGDKSMDASPDDDVPWKSLTSFAIYKLFLEWQNEGITVPSVGMPKAPGSATVNSENPAKNPMRKVPDNPTERHPVMLLNHMKPGSEFLEVSRTGNPPDITFTMQTVIDDKIFTGVGKNKKEAKKEAAKSALLGIFDIRYQ